MTMKEIVIRAKKLHLILRPIAQWPKRNCQIAHFYNLFDFFDEEFLKFKSNKSKSQGELNQPHTS